MSSSGRARAPRVCVLTTAHHTTDSRVVHREARSLEAAGYDVTYYTPFDDDCPIDVVSYGDHSSGSIPPTRDRIAYVGKLVRMLRDSDYDVYHLHNVELLPAGILLGLLSDGTVVYDVHENVEDVLAHKNVFPRPVRPYLARVISELELRLSRFVDGLVAAAPDLVERFEDHGEVTVVTNYPRRTLAEGTDLGELRSAGERGSVQFVYCGHLSENRGILTLIEAVEHLPERYDVSLVLGGEYASDETRDRIRRRASETERVELVGWLPTFADVIELFRESDVGVFCFHPDPNKTAAVHRSNKLFQYMATGLPIVVSDVGDWPDFVDASECGIAVDPESPESIADAMAELVEDPDLRASLARNGHEAALEEYNWETQREKLLALYERVTGGVDGTEFEGEAGARTDPLPSDFSSD